MGGVILIARGSRGDVMPLAVIMQRCIASGMFAPSQLQLITHAAHCDWLCNALHIHDKNLYTITSSEPVDTTVGLIAEDRIFCNTLLRCYNDIRLQHRSDAPTLLLFNLFALDAVHVASKLNLHAIAVSPFVPRQAPDALIEQLWQHTEFLHANEAARAAIKHWLWPAVLERFDAVREQLQLTRDTLTDVVQLCQNSERNCHARSAGSVCCTLYLSLESAFVWQEGLQQQRHVSFLGFAQLLWCRGERTSNIDTMSSLIRELSVGLIVLTLGSAVDIAEEAVVQSIVNAVELCAQSFSYSLVIVGSASKYAHQIYERSVCIHDDDLDLCPLLGNASLLCCHGGIGTLATAIYCGAYDLKVAICPLHFDQQHNLRIMKSLLGDTRVMECQPSKCTNNTAADSVAYKLIQFLLTNGSQSASNMYQPSWNATNNAVAKFCEQLKDTAARG